MALKLAQIFFLHFARAGKEFAGVICRMLMAKGLIFIQVKGFGGGTGWCGSEVSCRFAIKDKKS
jgi:hypothetical protein